MFQQARHPSRVILVAGKPGRCHSRKGWKGGGYFTICPSRGGLGSGGVEGGPLACYPDPCFAHLVQGAIDVPGFELDTATAFYEEVGSKPFASRIERCELDTVVGSQTENIGFGDDHLPKVLGKTGRSAASVVVEPTVAVDVGIGAFLEHSRQPTDIEISCEFGPVTSLNAVWGPENLGQSQ